MHEAAKRGNYDMLKECLKNNVCNGKFIKIFELIFLTQLYLQKKVSCNSFDKAGNTPLHWAAYGGHIDCVKLLLDSSNSIINLQV